MELWFLIFFFFMVSNLVLHLVWPNESLVSFYEDTGYRYAIISLLVMVPEAHKFTHQVINSHSWSERKVEKNLHKKHPNPQLVNGSNSC